MSEVRLTEDQRQKLLDLVIREADEPRAEVKHLKHRLKLESEQADLDSRRLRDERAHLAAANALLERCWEEWGAPTDSADDPVTQGLSRDLKTYLASAQSAEKP